MVIVHADTEPRGGWVPEVLRAVNKAPEVPAFGLGQRFGGSGAGLLGVEMLNEQRVMFGGAVFGDQTMIIRQKALERIDGFPEQPLMEDVEVSARLLEWGVLSIWGWSGKYRRESGRETSGNVLE